MRNTLLSSTILVAMGLMVPGSAEAYWFKSCSYGSYWTDQTQRVADINPGPADAVHALFGFGPRRGLMAVYQGALYFQADDGQSGAELWRASGGTAVQVAELAPGPAGSSPHAFAVFQNRLYFAATTPSTGEELFRFDGSTASLAVETDPGKDGGEITGLTVFDGSLYFARAVPNGGQQVWRFDGTTAEPVTAINAAPGRVVAGGTLGETAFLPFAGKLYYVRQTPLPEHYELWVYDGTSATMLKALTSGNDITSYAFDLGVYQGALYFGVVASDPGSPWSHHDELWRYAGQGAPQKVASLGSAASFTQPAGFQIVQGKLYFEAGSRLHRYDGSVVTDLSAAVPGLPKFPKSLSVYPSTGRLFFSGSGTDWKGNEPYLFDGAGAHLLKDIMPQGGSYSGSFPTFAEEADGLYFFAEDETTGRELWRTASQEIPRLDCYIVVAAIWENWLEWPVDRRDVVVATWWLSPESAAPRLVSREAVAVARGEEWRAQVLALDTRRGSLPEGFALATVVFDRETGERLDQGFDVVGVPAPRARVRMERTAWRLLNQRSLRQVAAERLRPLGAEGGAGR